MTYFKISFSVSVHLVLVLHAI